MVDLGDVEGGLLAQARFEVQVAEVGVLLHVLGPIPAKARLGVGAQTQDQILGLWRQVRLLRNTQRGLPMNYLRKGDRHATRIEPLRPHKLPR